MRFITVLIVLALAVAAAPSWADFFVGGEARYLAMGGAGLAAVQSPDVTAAVNPAALALIPSDTRVFYFPSGSLRGREVTTDELFDNLDTIPSFSESEGIELAREFGAEPTLMDVDASIGFGIGHIAGWITGEARQRIIPNDPFREFVITGTLPADPSAMEAIVWSESAVSIPAVAIASRMRLPHEGMGDLWVGGRVRVVRGKYTQRTITWSGSFDPANALQSSHEPTLNESGIGIDAGAIYLLPKIPKTSVGIVITNLIKPDLGPIEQGTIVSVGAVSQLNPKLMVAADLVNLTNAYGDGTDLRMGIELTPNNKIALRFGHSGDSFTWGFRVFGIDLAFASDMPLSLSRTIRF